MNISEDTDIILFNLFTTITAILNILHVYRLLLSKPADKGRLLNLISKVISISFITLSVLLCNDSIYVSAETIELSTINLIRA